MCEVGGHNPKVVELGRPMQPLNGSVETMQLLTGLVRKTLASETSRRDGKL